MPSARSRNSPDYNGLALRMKPACVKARVARKSRGQQWPYGFDSRPRHVNRPLRYLGGRFFLNLLQICSKTLGTECKIRLKCTRYPCFSGYRVRFSSKSARGPICQSALVLNPILFLGGSDFAGSLTDRAAIA